MRQKKNRLSFKLMLSLLGLFCCVHASATENILDLSLTELLNLKVSTVSKKEESILTTPAPVRILTRNDISRLGFANLEQTLNYLTGISSVNGEGNVFTTYTIRGNTLVNFNTNTLLLINGVPVYSPYHNSFDLAVAPLIAIERIELIPGAQSVLYGSNAINAVINIITSGEEKNESKHLIRYGSFEDVRLASNNQFEALNGWMKIALDLYSRQGEEQLLIDEAANQVLLDDEFDSYSLFASWQSDQWSVQIDHYQRELPNYRTRGFSTLQENEETGLQASGQYKTKNQYGDFTTRLSYFDWQLIKTFIPTDGSASYYWDYTGSLLDLQLVQSLEVSETHKGSFGIDLTRGTARRFKEDLNAFDIGLFDQPTNSYAIYWNAEVKLNQTNQMVYGARFYESQFKDVANSRTVTLSDVSPRLGWINLLDDNTSFKILYSEAFRVPTYFEKQVSSSRVLGNSQLEPETSQSFDLVFTRSFDNWQFEINPFLMKIEDKITRVDLNLPPSDPDFGKRQNQNIGDVLFSGVEINARYAFEKSLSGVIGAGWYDGENKTTNADLGLTYSYMIHGLLSYQMSDQWSLDTSAKFLSDWGAADSYANVNVTLNYAFNQSNQSRLFFRIENLLDENIRLPEIGRENPSVPTIPEMAESHYYLGVELNY